MSAASAPRLGGAMALLAAVAVVSACAADAVDDAAGMPALAALTSPALVLVGTPLVARGVGLAGATLRLEGQGGALHAQLASAVQEGDGEVAEGVVVAADIGLTPGPLRRACLVADPAAGRAGNACIALSANKTTGPLPPLSLPLIAAADGAAADAVERVLGSNLRLSAAGLPLGSEGVAWVRLQDAGGAVALAAEVTATLTVEADRGAAHFALGAGLGLSAGERRLRARLERQRPGEAAELGPWGPPWTLRLLAPGLVATAGALRPGEVAPLALVGCPHDGDLWLEVEGTWRRDGAVVAAFGAGVATLEIDHSGAAPRAFLPTQRYFAEGWSALQGGAALEGRVRLRRAGWQGAWHAVAWTLGARTQHVWLRFDPGGLAALWRFGLGKLAQPLRQRTLALARLQVAPYAIAVHDALPPAVIEHVVLDVLGDDPNGLGLLGSETSPGKDVGNLHASEPIGGFCDLAWQAGLPAFGGVFVASFLRFSPTLLPSGGSVDARFDALFAPFAPELGGAQAASVATPGAAAALEALAQLIAGTATHELGHALGLAAGTDDWHHAGDHPGWRMDAGPMRPFAERAALPGAKAEIWGVVDDAYLQATLPKAAP